MTGELAAQIDAASTSLGDVAQIGAGTVLEFQVIGGKGSFMATHIPKGIKVMVPGWMVAAGLVGAFLTALAAMSVARGVMDFMAARRLLSQAARREGAEEVEAEEERQVARDLRREWELEYIAWSAEFREETGHSPTISDQNDWIADNPMPPLGK